MSALNLADIRRDYAKKELSPDECLTDPVAQFSVWMAEALEAQVATRRLGWTCRPAPGWSEGVEDGSSSSTRNLASHSWSQSLRRQELGDGPGRGPRPAGDVGCAFRQPATRSDGRRATRNQPYWSARRGVGRRHWGNRLEFWQGRPTPPVGLASAPLP
jgi:hypothetical protein